jgi:hypothetical protein
MSLAIAAPDASTDQASVEVLRAHNQTLIHAIRHAIPVLHLVANALDAGVELGPAGVLGVIADLQGALDITAPIDTHRLGEAAP